MKLSMIYIALLAKRAELAILKDGFKNVMITANKLAKGTPRARKGAFFAAVYKALKNLKMHWRASNDLDGSKWVEVRQHDRESILKEGAIFTQYEITNGAQFIPAPKRYKVFLYSLEELINLSENYNFKILVC